MCQPKVSIITVSYNSRKYIQSTIESVLSQTYCNIEYIIIDGNSTDGTVDIIKSYNSRISKFISESDGGIYNAINKGINLATGDIIGILNSDDFFAHPSVVTTIAHAFESPCIEMVYGDVRFVKCDDITKVVRYYSSKKFSIHKFQYGFMPAHPSCYIKKDTFLKYGYYKEDYLIGSDFEILIRFLHTHGIKNKYIEMPFVTMRMGGVSNKSLKSFYILNKEIIRACRENSIKTNALKVYLKYFIKIFEFIRH